MATKLVALPVWFENHVRALFNADASDADYEKLFDETFAKDATFVVNGNSFTRDQVKANMGSRRNLSSKITVTFNGLLETPLKQGDEVVPAAGLVAGTMLVTTFSKFLVHDVRQKTEMSVVIISIIRPDPSIPSDQGQDNRRVFNNTEVVVPSN